MIPYDTQIRIIDKVKKHPDLWREFSKCCGDQITVYGAYKDACIDWMHRGGKDELKRHKAQSKTLRAALKVMAEQRETLAHNLAGRVIHDKETGRHLTLCPWLVPDSPVHAGPVLDSVMSVMNLLADDLDNRNPKAMEDRKDTDFYRVLGRRFSKAGLEQPPVKALRGLFKILADTVYGVDHALVLKDDDDDSNVINAYKRGVVKSAKK
jgi:hypothetical protein